MVACTLGDEGSSGNCPVVSVSIGSSGVSVAGGTAFVGSVVGVRRTESGSSGSSGAVDGSVVGVDDDDDDDDVGGVVPPPVDGADDGDGADDVGGVDVVAVSSDVEVG